MFGGNATVLVVGDVILDRYMVGTANRVSPEAPVPVIDLTSEFSTLGGAGNTAANIRALGGKCIMVSVAGDDPASYELIRLCAPGDHVITVDGRATTVKTRVMSSNYQITRVDREDRSEITEKYQDQLTSLVHNLISQVDVIVISDYNKGVVTERVGQCIIRNARLVGKPVIADPKGSNYLKYAQADYVTPNLSELNQAIPLRSDSDNDIRNSAIRLMQAVGIKNILVTMSERGMMLVPRYGESFRLPSAAKEVYDVTGAGDTVVAALALSLASKFDVKDAVRIANAAAGVVVGKVGTSVCSISELQSALTDAVDSFDIDRQVSAWKNSGLKIGFANGCFDVLHAGHVHLLSEAKKCCDRLVVAINSDQSVSLLKGNGRPINRQEQREAVLRALSAVDAVIVFDEPTPFNLIHRLRPDVLIKGSDHTLESIVGADDVVKWGGSINIVDRLEGLSSTSIISRTQGNNDDSSKN